MDYMTESNHVEGYSLTPQNHTELLKATLRRSMQNHEYDGEPHEIDPTDMELFGESLAELEQLPRR